MSSFSASVQTTSGNLSVTRPLSAPAAVDSVVDDVIYAVRNSDAIQSVSLSVVTADSPTPAAEAAPDKGTPAAADPLAAKTADK